MVVVSATPSLSYRVNIVYNLNGVQETGDISPNKEGGGGYVHWVA